MVIEIIKEIKKAEEEAQKIVGGAQEKVKGERTEWDDAKLKLKEETESEASKKIEEIRKEAQKAIDELSGKTLDNREIVVNKARPKAPRDNRFGGGGGGFGRGGDRRRDDRKGKGDF